MRVAAFAVAVAAPVAAASAQAPAFNLEAAPASLGAWTYNSQAGGSEAAYVDAIGTARVTLRCTRATRRVMLLAVSAAPAGSATITTSNVSRSVVPGYDAATRRITIDLPFSDALLDAIAFSRGRFAITIGGGVPLVFPATPEPARVVEDCRI